MMTPYDLPFLQNGVPNAPLVICRIFNGHISAMGHPIHFIFRSKVGFSGSAGRMALFPVRSNPGWQPAAILENYSGIARFPCDSTAFLFVCSFAMHSVEYGDTSRPSVLPSVCHSSIIASKQISSPTGSQSLII